MTVIESPRLHGDLSKRLFFIPTPTPEDWRALAKAYNRARYLRAYARHKPITSKVRIDDGPPHRMPRLMIEGFVEYMQAVIRMQFGQKGQWGHGRYISATKRGPGRRRVPPQQQNRPAGAKFSRRFRHIEKDG